MCGCTQSASVCVCFCQCDCAIVDRDGPRYPCIREVLVKCLVHSTALFLRPSISSWPAPYSDAGAGLLFVFVAVPVRFLLLLLLFIFLAVVRTLFPSRHPTNRTDKPTNQEKKKKTPPPLTKHPMALVSLSLSLFRSLSPSLSRCFLFRSRFFFIRARLPPPPHLLEPSPYLRSY